MMLRPDILHGPIRDALQSMRTAALLCLALLAPASAEHPAQLLPLWRIDGDVNSIYLLGSVHMLRASDHPLPAALFAAYGEVDELVMELDMDDLDPLATRALVNELGLIADGRQLHDLLGPEHYAQAESLAARIDVPLAMLASAEPWFAAVTVDALILMRIGFTPAHGVETVFTDLAARDGKTISGLETERQQFEMLDGLSADAQRELLLQTLAEGENVAGMMDELIAAWRTGDTKGLEDGLLQELKRYPELYRSIVVRRNENWVQQISGMLDEERSYLIIVGALHLVGADGVPSLLRNRGHAVSQLRQQN